MLAQVFNGLENTQASTVMLLFLLLAFPFSACADTPGAPTPPSTPALIPLSPTITPVAALPKQPGLSQGLYESCAPSLGEICFARLSQMAQAGFTLVLNYDQLDATADQELAYARQASALGMKIIWTLHNPVLWNGGNVQGTFSHLSATCNCSGAQSFIRYVISLVKGLPATWGYYIGDEVSVSDHVQLQVLTNLVEKLDPDHPRLFVGAAYSSQAVQRYLAPFADTADVLGVDYYPIGTSDSISEIASIARALQMLAHQDNRQSALVLQAFSWTLFPNQKVCSPSPGCAHFPTLAEMHQMYELAIRNAHPALILWFSYYGIVQSDAPAQHWEDLIEAAQA